MPVNSFRDLRVWSAAMTLVEKVYRLTQSFPKSETYGLTAQIQRAAVSIPSNIAEGHTREHTKEFLNHLSIAHGSLAELDTQLDIAARLGYISLESLLDAQSDIISLAKQLYALRNSLQRSQSAGST